jgi:predicted nucleic acid-binding protein
MSYEFVIDSYAWLEYFRGSASGRVAKGYIESGTAATSAVTLAELREKYIKEKWESFEEDSDFLTTKTYLVPVEKALALLAGEINHSQKKVVKDWGMADSLILATARNAFAKVVTGDRHFEGLAETIMI